MSLSRSSRSTESSTAYLVATAAVAVAVAVWPWGHNPFGPAKLAVTFVAAAVACAFIALTAGTRARFLAGVRSPIAIATGAFAAVPILALVTSLDVRASVLGEYPGYTGLVTGAAWLVIAAAAMCVSPERLRIASGRAVSVALAAVGFYALLQRFGVQPIRLGDTLDLARTGSLLGNAANLGVWIAIAVPLALDRVRAEERSVWRSVAAAAAASGVLASAFTGSRGGWIGLCAGLVMWWLVTRRQKPAGGRATVREPGVVVIAAAVVALLIVGIAVTPSSASRLVGGGTASATGRGRLAVWSATITLVAKRPVLGWGVAAFGRAFPRYATVATLDPTGRTDALDDPHNLELSVAASSGLAGVVALFALVLVMGVAVRRQAARGGGWVGAIAGGLAGGFVATQFHFVTLETGALMALLVGSLAALDCADAREDAASLRAAWVPAAVMAIAAVLAVGIVAADTSIRGGFAAAASGDTPRAAALFERAEKFAPLEPAVAWARGRAMLTPVARGDAGALVDGAGALRRAIDRMPGDARPMRDLGDLYIAAATQGIGDESATRAHSAYDDALALAPLDARAWLGSGVAASLAGDLSSAERDITHALELAPRFTDAWLNLAAVYDATGDSARAADAREHARAAN